MGAPTVFLPRPKLPTIYISKFLCENHPEIHCIALFCTHPFWPQLAPTYQKVNLNLLLLFGNDDSSKLPLVHTSRPRVAGLVTDLK